ncbi:hypothetical protein EGR_02303 [Echinococcus granulosus]|uniref:Uncharacterized protein n=1 Tax=Echinococcus granulosus TaxID=6210 RepID=W6UWK2_ECHGR|nr:hypothetical protein EGR_02303 [Echinococcus granulosus]EUB62862.1 hypothetical protein EGR_02303 [Echinococcus granulosus]
MALCSAKRRHLEKDCYIRQMWRVEMQQCLSPLSPHPISHPHKVQIVPQASFAVSGTDCCVGVWCLLMLLRVGLPSHQITSAAYQTLPTMKPFLHTLSCTALSRVDGSQPQLFTSQCQRVHNSQPSVTSAVDHAHSHTQLQSPGGGVAAALEV